MVATQKKTAFKRKSGGKSGKAHARATAKAAAKKSKPTTKKTARVAKKAKKADRATTNKKAAKKKSAAKSARKTSSAMNVTEFTATLYFKTEPALTAEQLFETWGREGYTCEWHEQREREADDLFAGFRGGTLVWLKKPRPADLQAVVAACPDYPNLAKVNIDWDSAFCINPKAAWKDVQRASHEIEFVFRIVAESNQPKMAHNELVATLLGIHQAAPLQALWLHSLGVLIGRQDLDEYLAYADSNTEEARAQFAPMLAFGSFVRRDADTLTAWTTGLGHFDHDDLWLEEKGLNPNDALALIFNTGYMITGGHRYPAGDTMETRNVHCRFLQEPFRGKPALRLEWLRERSGK